MSLVKRKRSTNNDLAVCDDGPSRKRVKSTGSPPATRPPAVNIKALLADKSPFVETPTNDDRKREAALYGLLGSDDGEERIAAADTIVTSLLGRDSRSSSPVPGQVLIRHLDKRLFRGICSGRNASRVGFSLVLTELLSQLFGPRALAEKAYPMLTFETILGILVENTKPLCDGMKREESDRAFGLLFGLECLVSAGTPFGSHKRWQAVLNLLLGLAHDKVSMRSHCGWVVVQAVKKMDEEMGETTLRMLVDMELARTPDGVGIWIAVVERFPGVKLPEKRPWTHPLEPGAVAGLPAALKGGKRECERGEEGESRPQKHANWTAQLHYVWDLILEYFLKHSGEKESDIPERFTNFWNRVVDDGFFSKSSSEFQRFSGFKIFEKTLDVGVDRDFVLKIIFSKNLMTCLVNHAGRKERYLHLAAVKTLKIIEAAVAKHPVMLKPVLSQLLTCHGLYYFDDATKSKTVERLLQHATPDSVDSVLKILKKSGGKRDESKYYTTLGNYLFKLANLPTKNAETRGNRAVSVPGIALRELTKLAYNKKRIPDTAKKTLREKATSAYANFVKRPEDFHHLWDAVISIKSKGQHSGEMGSEIQEAVLVPALERLVCILDVERKDKGPKAFHQALALLQAVAILQLYNQDPDAVDVLNELDGCYQKLIGKDWQDGEGMLELVEILLAMVVRRSSLTRQVSQQVFEALTHLVTAEALDLLLGPLEAEESAEGQQALFSTETEDINGEEDDQDDNQEADSDVEMIEAEDAASQGSDDESDDGEAEELRVLHNALAQALNTQPPNQNDKASDSDMTDSEMMALDEKLAEMFKQRKASRPRTSKRKDNKDAKYSVITFKHRILDLTATFTRKESPLGNALVLEVLPPLLHLVRTTSTKALASKAREIITLLGKNLKRAKVQNFDEARLFGVLAQIHEAARMDSSQVFGRAASGASLTVVGCMLRRRQEAKERVVRMYAEMQETWGLGEGLGPHACFFTEWVNWCQQQRLKKVRGKEESENEGFCELGEVDDGVKEHEKEVAVVDKLGGGKKMKKKNKGKKS